MSYPTRSEVEGNHHSDNNNNISVGYPKFSDVHESSQINMNIYRNIQNEGIVDPYYQQYQKQKKQIKQQMRQQNQYNYNPQQYPKMPKKKVDKYPKYTKENAIPQNKMVPKQKVTHKKNKNQYVNVPVQVPGPLYMDQTGQKYMAVPVGPPQLMPVAVPQYQIPYYQGQAMYAPPYYGQQQQISPNTVVVIPPGYKKDYSVNYSPWGNIADDFDNIF